MLQKIFEATGLDWLPILINEKKHFPSDTPKSLELEIPDIKEQIRSMDSESLKEVISQLEERLREEDSRRSTIESKATTLQGFAALAGSFVIGLAQFLIGNNSIEGVYKAIITILYLCIALSLLLTVIFSYRAVKTSPYSRPKVTDWLGLRGWNKEVISQNYVIDLFKSIHCNIAKGNDKGTYLIGAQDWFRNSIYLLITFAIVLSATIAFTPSKNEPLFEQPFEVYCARPQSNIFYSGRNVTLCPR